MKYFKKNMFRKELEKIKRHGITDIKIVPSILQEAYKNSYTISDNREIGNSLREIGYS